MTRQIRFQASLALNLFLLATVLGMVLHKSQNAPAPITREVTPGITTQETPVVIDIPKLAQYPGNASAADRQRWLVGQLRAAGVPNNIVAQVIHAELDETWQRRFEEANSNGNPDAMAALHLEQEKDMEAQMRAALGDAPFKQWDQEHLLREANIGRIQLNTAEADTIYDFKKQLQQRQWDLEKARLDGKMDDAEIDDATDKAYSELSQQMKGLLGDERFAKSQGVDDETAAANLRQDLAKVNPNDSQFQDLLKAQQRFNDRRSELDKQFQDNPSSADYAAQLKALDDSRDQEYQRVLGTNVFDALQKEQDIDYSKMKKYESIWGLDDNKVDYVYGAIKYYEKSVQNYQAQARVLESQGQSVDWDAAKKNLQQFAQQTQQALQTYLGPDSFSKMQRNGVFQFNQLSE